METSTLLNKRLVCGYAYYWDGFSCVYQGGWYYWGRWVVAALAVLLLMVALISCLCVSRRRRRAGVQPMYGTGWMAPNANNNANNGNYGYYEQNMNNDPYNKPPAYGQQQPGAAYPMNPYPPQQDQHQQQPWGVQQPQNAYHNPQNPSGWQQDPQHNNNHQGNQGWNKS